VDGRRKGKKITPARGGNPDEEVSANTQMEKQRWRRPATVPARAAQSRLTKWLGPREQEVGQDPHRCSLKAFVAIWGPTVELPQCLDDIEGVGRVGRTFSQFLRKIDRLSGTANISSPEKLVKLACRQNWLAGQSPTMHRKMWHRPSSRPSGVGYLVDVDGEADLASIVSEHPCDTKVYDEPSSCGGGQTGNHPADPLEMSPPVGPLQTSPNR
jgi:hypothetical protein